MAKKVTNIEVKDTVIRTLQQDGIDYVCITDIARQNDEIDAYHKSLIYAEEADVLNVAMFGMTAKEWRDANPDKKGNIRDYATINELLKSQACHR